MKNFILNLQLFADAGTVVNTLTNGYVNANTGSTEAFNESHTLTPELKTFYDTELLEILETEGTLTGKIRSERYSESSVLVNGTGICGSYALAYRALMNSAGMECIYLSSEEMSEDSIVAAAAVMTSLYSPVNHGKITGIFTEFAIALKCSTTPL